ncbi:hypothetical protein Tco_0910808 [Tanacetum coccineum]|uniref:Uncharacterized protein n=1 Tax=Tanacetum coccineum TaxID=301880 RepID=A0ABQ5CUD3_9ASTR
MQTETKLALEQTQYGVSYEVSSDAKVFTMTMEILPEPTTNKLCEDGSEITKDGKVIGNEIRKNGLYAMKLGNKSQDKLCVATLDDNSTLYHRRLVEESLNVTFDESPPPTKLSPLMDDYVGEEEAIENKVKVDSIIENESLEVDEYSASVRRFVADLLHVPPNG